MNSLKSNSAFCLVWAKKIKLIQLLGGECGICGNKDIFSLEFHHKKDKDFNYGDLKGYRWSMLENEIKKCILLCANCHSELHYKGTQNGKIKEKFLLSKNLTRCSKCGYSGKNFSSLSFHHLRDKRFSITAALIRQISVAVQDLEDELEKCVVICKNCHRKEHSKIDQFNKMKDIIYKKIETHKELRGPIDQKEVLEMFSYGKKQKEIVQYFKCAKSTICEILKRNGIKQQIREKKKYNITCKFCKNDFISKRKDVTFCSKKCMGLSKRKDRPLINNLLEMRKTMTLKEIGEKFGVSGVAVYNWINKSF